jgi:hypothetical protein
MANPITATIAKNSSTRFMANSWVPSRRNAITDQARSRRPAPAALNVISARKRDRRINFRAVRKHENGVVEAARGASKNFPGGGCALEGNQWASETACATMRAAPKLKMKSPKACKLDGLPGASATSAKMVAIPSRIPVNT